MSLEPRAFINQQPLIIVQLMKICRSRRGASFGRKVFAVLIKIGPTPRCLTTLGKFGRQLSRKDSGSEGQHCKEKQVGGQTQAQEQEQEQQREHMSSR